MVIAATTLPARILVIDDEPQIRRFLDISLRAQGYKVELANSGQAGIDALARQVADLVILDIGLPDLDGHEVLQSIRQWTQVPVVMLTVRADEAEKVRALDAGANDYVTKPFGTQELMARVRSLLRKARAQAHRLSRCSTTAICTSILHVVKCAWLAKIWFWVARNSRCSRCCSTTPVE